MSNRLNAKFFGAPFDPDEREPKLALKIESCRKGYPGIPYLNPYEGVIYQLKRKLPPPLIQEASSLKVEPWLLPAPEPRYLPLLTVEQMVAFIDADGCREYAEKAAEHVRREVFPAVPAMVGVDHSLTGGCVKALTREHGGALGLIVLDSHFDAIIPSIRCGLIQYDVETNPESPFSPTDPFIRGRLDSYNADSFIYYLVHEGIVAPENVVVLGVADYPPPHAFEIKDPRVQRYLDFYRSLENMGVKIVKREAAASRPETVVETLKKVHADVFYLSVDMDIGARAALTGARFLDYKGLKEDEIYQLVDVVLKTVKGKLVGFDLMEIDVYNAGTVKEGVADRTYHIAAEIACKILKGKNTWG